MSTSSGIRLGLVAACLAASCGGRPSYWDKPVGTNGVTYGLAGGVAVVDDAEHRVVFLTGTPNQELTKQSLPIGHHFASAQVSADGSTLFVLSSGDWPVQTSSDQLPSLTVVKVDSQSFHASAQVYTLSEPLSTLALDRDGMYAVAYQGAGSSASFAENPNEIVIFDLSKGFSAGSPTQAPNPVARSIRSFGGTPQRLTFSPSLMLPVNAAAAGVKATARRLLLIETTIDVTIVDLTNAFEQPVSTATAFGRPEITVRLTGGTSATSVAPAGLVIDPNPADGRIALRTASDTNIYTLQLIPAPGPVPAGHNDFTPYINITDVGGTPTDIQFVQTSVGLRVAALVPAKSNAVLVEPDQGLATPVALSSPYTTMSLVTKIVSGAAPNGPNPTDVALLWNSSAGVASGVALWTLGTPVGKSFQAVEVLEVAAPIQAVLDVPPPHSNLKVLATQGSGLSGGSFYVLDLAQRTANPIQTTSAAQLTIAPDGQHMWAYDQGTNLASIDFTTLNPVPVTTEAPISVVYDVANPGVQPGAGRSLIAIHAQGTLGATVFNARSPQATSRREPALLLEGP